MGAFSVFIENMIGKIVVRWETWLKAIFYQINVSIYLHVINAPKRYEVYLD